VILDSKGNKVELPDPEKIERLMDDLVMSAPLGNFESSTDSINNTVQIPNVFTFGAGPYLADGEFGVGPFAGVSAVSNAVHSSEINLIEAAQRAEISQGIDSEIYLGIALQNAVDPAIRLPSDKIVKPSQWLREVAPDVYFAELEDQIAVPGAGVYPFLKPSLFTYNGLVFSPRSGNSSDIASGPFLFAANAMAAFQNSLVPPANKSPANEAAIASGSVRRGAAVFADAGCASCHKPPFFTDNKIHKWRQIRTNPARGQSRLALEPYLVPPKLYSFDTPVPPPANAEVIEVPTQEYSLAPNRLPANLAPKGGYRTTSLVGLYLSAPYLHDGGVAVGKDALKYETSGAFSIADSARLGLPGTLLRFEPADPYASLRALVDRNLRAKVIERNRSAPQLVKVNLDGTGHEFYVDEEEGYTSQQQTDLINFLMALDDNPGQF
jgi:hypothetical protein